MSALPRPRVDLVKPVEDRILGGHPWLFDGAVAAEGPIEPGTVVDVHGRDGAFVARGIWDPTSPIRVRLFTRDATEDVDDALVARRVAAAFALRRDALDLARVDAFRLLHGEADQLPGIVCDVYSDVAVLQVDTPAVAGMLAAVARAVRAEVPAVRTVVHKARRGEPGPPLVALSGSAPRRPVTIHEHGLRFLVDVAGGQKTGFFLDQRDHRERVRGMARGRRVLDLFAYTGGFTVAAAAGGATRITSVDAAAPALAMLRRNLALNGFDPGSRDLRIVASDVFRFLEGHTSGYEIVICDPPSMAPARAARAAALGAYERLNALALARVVPGGRLLTASCSSRVSTAELAAVVERVARKARRTVRLARRSGAPPDHPVIASFPEGRYLSWLEVHVDPGAPRPGTARAPTDRSGGRRRGPATAERRPNRGSRSRSRDPRA